MESKQLQIPIVRSRRNGSTYAAEGLLYHSCKIYALRYKPQSVCITEKMEHNYQVPKMTAGRAALLRLMNRYLEGLLDPTVSLLEVHKLMYFMQEAGEPLRLKYKKAHYGPYAENLRHVFNAIEGHFVSGYADGGDAPEKPLQLVPEAVEEANLFLQDYSETRARFEKVASLVEGFESAFGLELLSTVHWVMKHEPSETVDDIVEQAYDWNGRKRKFTPRQIAIAVDLLTRKQWVD